VTQAEWDRRRGRIGMNLREGMRAVYYVLHGAIGGGAVMVICLHWHGGVNM